jgi:phosphatidylglycerol:prolipoprotein diacylglycerol transferase
VNGDIVGYPSNLPWATVYVNPNSWACLPGSPICNVPVQPAAVYEIFCNLVMLGVLLYLARRVQRPGILALVYLFGYTITQFLVFFVRSNVVVNFLGTFILKQAQWTSVVVFILLIPISYLVMRWHYAQPVPANETAITYGIPQKASTSGQPETKTVGEDIANVDDEQHITHVADPAEAVAGAEAKDVSSSTGDEQSDEQAAHAVNPAETTPKEEPTDEVSARANTSDKPEL